MPKLLKDTFKAWIDTMPGPGSQKKLIVIGKAEVPTGGWTGSMRRANPQGINPKILIVDVTLQKPSGPAPDVISKIDLRYEEAPPQVDYSNVTVRYDNEEFTIPVGATS